MQTYAIILILFYMLDTGVLIGKTEEALNINASKPVRLLVRVITLLMIFPLLIMIALNK